MPRNPRHAAAAIGLCCLVSIVPAEGRAVTLDATFPLTFEAPSDDGTPRDTPALLTLPEGAGPHPLVVLLHDELGPDGRGGRLAEALAEAGIATLQPDLWLARGLTPEAPDPTPADARALLPDVFAALDHVAHDARVDPRRIGVAGFGIGGRAALLARAEAWGAAQLGRPGPRFAAHAALYPDCALLRAERNTLALHARRRSPVLLLAAGRDPADAPATCAAATPLLPVEALDATHAWDLPGAHRLLADRASPPRPVREDQAATAAATARLVAFFGAALRPIEAADARPGWRPGLQSGLRPPRLTRAADAHD